MPELRMPQISLGDEEVIVVRWHKAIGDAVALGEPLLEVETDKASMDVEAPFEGTLSAQHCAVGDAIVPGAVIGYVAAGGEPAEGVEAPAKPATATTPFGRLVPSGELRGLPPVAAAAAPTKERSEPLETLPAGAPHSDRPLSRRRRAIARRLSQAAAIPQFAVTRTIGLDAARDQVESLRAAGKPATLTDAIAHAVAAAAAGQPAVNAWLVDETIRIFEHVALALAVETDDGVIAPVLRDAERLDLAEIADRRADLVGRARAARLRADELDGATLTLTNVGPMGGDVLLPVLTPPQVSVIGVGRDMSDGATFTFVGDHRALDGADGARYLVRLEDALHTRPAG